MVLLKLVRDKEVNFFEICRGRRSCCGTRHGFPSYPRGPWRPRPLAQVASSAPGGAPIAPPDGPQVVALSAFASWQKEKISYHRASPYGSGNREKDTGSLFRCVFDRRYPIVPSRMAMAESRYQGVYGTLGVTERGFC